MKQILQQIKVHRCFYLVEMINGYKISMKTEKCTIKVQEHYFVQK